LVGEKGTAGAVFRLRVFVDALGQLLAARTDARIASGEMVGSRPNPHRDGTFMRVSRLAWRNVWRNRRRSLVTMAAMTFALWAMILYSALVEGYLAGLERNALDLELGDIEIHAAGYRDDPSLYTKLEDPERILAALDDLGYPASAHLRGTGLAAAGNASSGVSLRGLDPARDAKVSKIGTHVMDGEWLDTDAPQKVVIGKALARTLRVGVGDEIVLLSQGADGSIANDLYRVGGILASVSYAVDRSGIYMTSDAFRELMVFPTGAHEIVVRRPPDVPLARATERVAAVAPDADVAGWRDLAPTVASMVDLMRTAMGAMFFIVYVAIGMVILNSTLMAVFERVREFGVLKALGMGPLAIVRIVFTETTVQMVLSMGVGVVLSIPALLWLHDHGIDLSALGGASIAGVAWDPIWRAEINEHAFVDPIVIMFVIVNIAVVYPALKAALIRPVDSMHHH
jgi:ABC-type lipoprotein release transport system permease subunit